MTKVSELEIGESCRYGNRCCTRVKSTGENISLVTSEFELLSIKPDEEVFSAFDFEGMDKPGNDGAIVGHIIKCIERIESMFELNCVNSHWKERMKKLAADILKPGESFTFKENHLHVLDYIWDLGGDEVIYFDRPYHARAIDYYLGRRCEHIWGKGVLFKIVKDTDKNYDHGKMWISEELFNRGIEYGIAIDFPCACGNVTFDMFAIPGIHNGAFGYLVKEGMEKLLDVRNHCMVCGPYCISNSLKTPPKKVSEKE